jgi:penicillin-binding protein 2
VSVALRDRLQEAREFRLRLGLITALIVIAFSTLAARWAYLQVSQHVHYQTLAENNRISIVPIVPNRGLIVDRNGIVLADNYSAYTLEVTPGKVKDLEATIAALAEVVEITARDRKRFSKLLEDSHRFDSLPIRLRLSDEEVARFAVNRYRFPGVEINARLFRRYPLGQRAAHVLGYIGRINDKDLQDLEAREEMSNYRGSDHLGKVGIEKSYEKQLHGVTGFEEVETDAGGRALRSLKRNEAISGRDVVLTIDIKLQEVAEKVFGERRGALVAIDPRNGEVLALVSVPSYDPNLFIDGIDQVNWDALNNSPDTPLTNRALRGGYPPGSTIKPFMALAGLHSGKRHASSAINDPGFFSLPGGSHRYRDWKAGGHGVVDLKKSVVISCDTYYYGLARDLEIDALAKFMSKFSFGQPTGIDIENEAGGVLPSREWKRKRFKQVWYPGETVIAGIGQGYWLTTPLQLAHATATIANDGLVVRPRLAKALRDSATGALQELAAPAATLLNVRPDHIAFVKDAMHAVTQPGGTAARAADKAEYAFAGKTGTAQVIGIKQTERYVESRVAERHRDHALFIAYAPAVKPTIALAVIVENGGHGGATAAPVARAIFDYHLVGKLPGQMQPAEEEAADAEHD